MSRVATTKKMLLILVFFNMIDAISTAITVPSGESIELNPLMFELLNYNVMLFVIVKFLASILIYMAYKKISDQLAHDGFFIVAFIFLLYAVIVVLHLIGFTLSCGVIT